MTKKTKLSGATLAKGATAKAGANPVGLTPARQQEIITTARLWLGTPYLHQSSAKHHGCDCLGFVRGLWRELVGGEPETPPAYTPDWSERGARELLWAAALRHLTPVKPIDTRQTGDIVLLRMVTGSVAKHLAVLAQGDGGFTTIIHAYSGVGVVETPLTPSWQGRIVAQFRFPNRR